MKSKGFTLIELLVVIAIIGILASVVLASLNSARGKGADVAIKANINNARAQAELYYTDNGNFTTACTAGANNLSQFASGATTAGATNVKCVNAAGSWALEGQLKTSTTFYCVDFKGNATTTAASSLTQGTDHECGVGNAII